MVRIGSLFESCTQTVAVSFAEFNFGLIEHMGNSRSRVHCTFGPALTISISRFYIHARHVDVSFIDFWFSINGRTA